MGVGVTAGGIVGVTAGMGVGLGIGVTTISSVGSAYNFGISELGFAFFYFIKNRKLYKMIFYILPFLIFSKKKGRGKGKNESGGGGEIAELLFYKVTY